MATMASLPFDSDLGYGPRSAPFWTHESLMDPSTSPNSLASQDFSSSSSTMSHGSEPSLTPPTIARSLTSSPPRAFLTPEQHEIKREDNRARRESRFAARRRRVSNHTSYLNSPAMSPLPDMPSPMDMPSYTSSPTSASLLSHSAGSLGTSPYMPSYIPPLHDPSQAQMFTTSYTHSMPHGYGTTLDYSGPSSYTSSGSYSRGSPLPVGHDNSLMYQMPTSMTGGALRGNTSSPPGTVTSSPEGGQVRVVQSRPKPRCWDHGCNGQQFSTSSNLLRHQREKSGQASKASCPHCGAVFTRTTARNGHMQHDKCRQQQRRNS